MILGMFSGVLLLGVVALNGSGQVHWGPDQLAFIIPILGLQIIGIITAWRHSERASDAAADVSRQVEAVHYEIRPPSNGTTTGALQEFIASWIPWLYEELRLISEELNIDQHATPPSLPQVQPPARPRDLWEDKRP